jgi:hypothetical protein
MMFFINLCVSVCAIAGAEALQLDRSLQNPSRRRCLNHAATIASSSVIWNHPVPPASAYETDDPSYLPFRSGGSVTFDPVSVGDWNDMPGLRTLLGQARLQPAKLAPLPPTINPFANQELYYNPFIFGSWTVTATLKRKIFPFGPSYLPSTSLVDGSPRNRQEAVGNACTYELHYFSTLANTLGNQITVNLGTGIPQSRIIQDRAFNIISTSNAYQQLTPVQQVDWDQNDPTKLTLDYGVPVADDMRPLGRRRAQVYLNGRRNENSADGNTCCVAEASRSVLLAPGNVVVSDSESITEFQRVSDDHVTAISRVAVYLSPNPNSREGVLWQQVGGAAVGLYDYQLDMRRITEELQLESGATVAKACVRTPKDYIQCE